MRRTRTGIGRAGARTCLIGLYLAAAPLMLKAQALPFHTETAITSGFEEEAFRTFASVFGREGLRSDGSDILDPMRRDVDVYVQAFGLLPYAITPMWTTRIVVPFVRKSMDFTTPGNARLNYTSSGIGDVLLDTKWIFYSRNQLKGTTRVGIEGGVKIPLGSTDADLPGGTPAPRPLQLGSGSWDFPLKALFTLTRDRVGILANTGYRINTTDDGYRAGNMFSYDVAVGFRLTPSVYKTLRDKSLMVYLELNGTVQARDRMNGTSASNSGGHLLYVSPALQWIPSPWLLFEASVQFPVLQDLNGTQLEYDTRFQIGTRFRFSVLR